MSEEQLALYSSVQDAALERHGYESPYRPVDNIIYVKEEVHYDSDENSLGYLEQSQDIGGQQNFGVSNMVQAGMNSEPTRAMLIDKELNQTQDSSAITGDHPRKANTHFQLQTTVNTYCFQHETVNITQARDNLLAHGDAERLPCKNSGIGAHTSNSNVSKPIYTENKPFKCTLCDYSSSWACALKRHTATHLGLRPFKCSVCPYSCSQAGHLKKHMATHTGDRPFRCAMCPYTSSQPGHLKRHIMATHVEDDDKLFRCDVCPFSSSLAVALKRHATTHEQEKPFKCPLCPYSTRQVTDLNAHVANHKGEKQFKCPQCDYRTAFKSNIGKHLRTHTGDKPFHCTDCDYVCGDRTSLVSHTVRRHSNLRPFGCAHCQHRTVTKSDLVRHLKRKHDPNKS